MYKIESKDDYHYFLEADRIANTIPKQFTLAEKTKHLISPNYIWEFQKTLRKLEFYTNCKKGFVATLKRFLIKRKFKNLSHKLGFSIPPNVFGPGLSIAHYGTIVVNEWAKVGANCRLHVCVNIGTEAGHSNKAPTIGSNCYIGPGAKIYGAVHLADGIAIGANAVVNKTFVECNIAIAGAPAKKIGEVDTFDFIIPASQLLDAGYGDMELGYISAKTLREQLKNNPEIYQRSKKMT